MNPRHIRTMTIAIQQFCRIGILPVLCLWLFGGCSERIEPKPLTYTQLLTGTSKKSWRLVSIIEIDEGRSSGVNTPAQYGIPPCFADDLYTFYANDERRFEIGEGATKCNPADPDIFYTGNWSFVNANASLEFLFPVFAGVPVPYIVKTLTDNVLTIEFYGTDVDLSFRYTFNAVR